MEQVGSDETQRTLDELKRIRRNHPIELHEDKPGPVKPVRHRIRSVHPDRLPPFRCVHRTGKAIGTMKAGCSGLESLFGCEHPEVESDECAVHAYQVNKVTEVHYNDERGKISSRQHTVPICWSCPKSHPYEWLNQIAIVSRGKPSVALLESVDQLIPGAVVHTDVPNRGEDYVLIVDPDMEIVPGTIDGIDKAIELLGSNHDLVGVCGKIVYQDRDLFLSHDFLSRDDKMYVVPSQRTFRPLKRGKSVVAKSRPCSCGSPFGLFRKEVLAAFETEAIGSPSFYRYLSNHYLVAALADLEVICHADSEFEQSCKDWLQWMRWHDDGWKDEWGGVLDKVPPRRPVPKLELEPEEKPKPTTILFGDGQPINDVVSRFLEDVSRNGYNVRLLAMEKPPMGLKLIRRIFIGENFHRSGWPFAMASLWRKNDDRGILVNDFVEQSFLYRGREEAPPHTEPWVGFFHHPPNAPSWFWEDQTLQKLWTRQGFLDSLPHMIGAIALSDYLRSWLEEQLSCPVVTIKHPCGEPPILFGDLGFPEKPRLISFGWYLRDTRILWRIPDDDREKLRLWPGARNHNKFEKLVISNLGPGDYEKVDQLPYIPHEKFDQLLATSIPVCRVLDASATNGVIDCIVRNSPIVVNRHPAVEEYIGEDYPLLYDDVAEIPDLLPRYMDGHEYLKAMDKSWINGRRFADSVEKAVGRFAERAGIR